MFKIMHNKALVRMQTTLRFVCTAQLGRYAIALAFLSGHLAQYVKNYNRKVGYFVLDLLPGDQLTAEHQPGLEILKWLTSESSFLQMVWKDTYEEANQAEIGFCYANVMPDIGVSLSDWVAQSCHAAINADSFKSNIKRQKENRRLVAADVIFSIMEQYKKKGKDPEKIFFQIPLLSGFK